MIDAAPIGAIGATPKGMSRSEALRRVILILDGPEDRERAAQDAGLIPAPDDHVRAWLHHETEAGRVHAIAVDTTSLDERGISEIRRWGTIWVRKEGDALNVVGAAVAPGGPDFIAEVLPKLVAFARNLGCNRIGCRTARPGLLRRLSAAGFELTDLELQLRLE